MKLYILIPTLPEPESINFLKRLRSILDPQVEQYKGIVGLYIHDAPRSMPTGQKRNEMIRNTDSEYFSMIDCDDMVSQNYVQEIMKATQVNPDVISFNGYMTTEGKDRKDFVIQLGERYEERKGVFYRYPNHLCAFKRSLVQHVKFQNIWQQEDYIWATDVRNKGLLKTEVHINQDLYHYDFRTQKHVKPHSTVTSRRTRLR